MSTGTPNRTEIIHGYRHLYRGLLKAVQYSAPARFTAREQLRQVFRRPDASWNAKVVQRTLWFLEAAARERGLEHRILKNVLRVRMLRNLRRGEWRNQLHASTRRDILETEKEHALTHYEMTIAMLNKSMGIHLQ
ncbi:hypothetical protein CDD81_1152 [Ophiocordyceps australis]|uniref:Uncharacterized protein n=1 Tax=Ophiocordyceps australis TaxID=1399860 RepID=A0A2C5Y1Q2_9HYPO|nr:hypothetical protein CDD81_1152 [Ophiocordyceps australis]